MSYYSRVDRRMWGDAKFRELSPILPSAQGLWVYLLTGPHNNGLPGLFHVGRANLAESLGWELDDFDRCFAEIVDAGMVVADWRARVVRVVNVFKYRRPENPKHLKSWLRLFDEIPECEVRTAWFAQLKADLIAHNKADWLDAFDAPAHVTKVSDTHKRAARSTVSDRVSDTVSERVSDRVSDTDRDRDRDRDKDNVYPGVSDPALAAAPAAQPEVTSLAHARSKQEALFDVWREWAVQLEAKAVTDDQPPGMATLYVEHLERAAGEYWDNRGGKFTPKRRADLASRLGRLPPDAQLFAIEQYVNGHRTKDERYCAAIAERLNRLSEREFLFEVSTHRKANPNGIWTLSNDAIGVK